MFLNERTIKKSELKDNRRSILNYIIFLKFPIGPEVEFRYLLLHTYHESQGRIY